jgi:hypothetical protein
MTVSMPAHVSTNASAVSLAPLAGLRSPSSAKTIPFKNVLDGFETQDDENVPDSGEQKANPQGTASKKALPDATPEPFRAPQHNTSQFNASQYSAPQESVPQVPLSILRPAKVVIEVGQPTEETAKTQQDAPAPENSTTLEPASRVVAHPSAEMVEPDKAGLRPTGNVQRLEVKGSTVPVSSRLTAPSTARFAVSEQGGKPSTRSAAEEKSPAHAPQVRASVSPVQTPALPSQALVLRAHTPALPVQAPAARVQTSVSKLQAPVPSQKEVSLSQPGRAVTPVITNSENKTQATRTPAAATTPSQPKSTPPPSPRADAAPVPPARDTNAPVGNKSHIAAAAAPRAMDLRATPNASPQTITIAPAPNQPTRKTAPTPADIEPHPAAVQTEKTPTAQQSAPVTIAAAPAQVTQAPIVPKPKAVDSRSEVSTEAAPSNSAQTPDPSDAPKQAERSNSNAAPAVVANVPQAPLPESTVPTPDISEPPVASRDKAGEVVVAPQPALRIAASSENLAFAARMLPSDVTPVHAPTLQTKSPLTPAEPQVSQPKAAIPQTKPAATPSQQPQSEAPSNSSNSKRETQSTTPTEKSDTRAPKAVEVTQPEQAQGTVTQWSEVSPQQMSEAVYGRPAPELAEAPHAGSTLVAQETHMVAPELPKTSASSEILLHLTDNDQSAAAIRVADRAGSVNVSVHASDPVLRESLRSNLGELSNQLAQQGWKAEMLKPAAFAAQSESQQDSHSGGQQSPQQQQQHSSGGERQSQRDRRTPSGIWQQELDQQISSGDAHPGGNG